ncbi:MAG: hypothetical protein AseanaTS_10690 [Candidatus Pelagadaptatus aseana]|uniref:L,D-transpeptidase family protein n=1 Tax=Candidatus Pelagadaptatus aseana TaxID=3120508 RepID=UPI0039B34D44
MSKPANHSRTKTSLLALLLAIGSILLFYKAYEANKQLQPILPSLAAQHAMQRWFADEDPGALLHRSPINHLDSLRSIYRNNRYQMLWFNGYQLSDNGQQLIQQLLESSADELFDYQYHLAYIQQRLHTLQTQPREVTALDALMTDAFVAYMLDILNGKMALSGYSSEAYEQSASGPLKPVSLNRTTHLQDPLPLDTRQQRQDIVQLLQQNQGAEQIAEVLQGLIPQHQEYQRLRQAFNRYQTMVSDNNWLKLQQRSQLVLGDRHPQVAQMRALLTQTGDYQPATRAQEQRWSLSPEDIQDDNQQLETFDLALEQALKRFQARHGTKVDGVLGRHTRKLLNITPNFRLRQIALNMKRWRELPRDLGERYIWVNMTDYTLQLIHQGQVELDMRVIIGKEYRKTPVMSESIHSLVLNPHWNVPHRIAVNDLLPQIKQDPDYLIRRRFNVFRGWNDKTPENIDNIDWNRFSRRNFPYRLQQKPGQGNALGRIKFVIPNDQSIYLHDTSNPQLFERDIRTLSSGCVRVEKPFELANALIRGSQHWNPERLQQNLGGDKTRYVKLPEPIPTYLFYQTVWVDEDEVVHFRDDIYQGDLVVHKRLSQPISL